MILAIDVVHYERKMERAVVDHSIAPMSATLSIETTDGSVVVFKSVVFKSEEQNWKSAQFEQIPRRHPEGLQVPKDLACSAVALV